MPKINYYFNITAAKLAGYIVILAAIVLSAVYPQSTIYWSVGIPSGAGLLTAKTLGDSWVDASKAKNGKNKLNENT